VQTLEPIVAGLPLFSGLKPAYIQLISGCCANVRFEAGEFMGREGEPADKFWVIRQGRVALEIHAPGRGALTIQTIGDDEVVGWSWLVPPYQLRFDVHAITSTRALMFDGKCLRQKFVPDPELGYELVQRFSRVMVSRLEAMSLQLLDLYGDHYGEHE
jgi:CRP/FNR family transcriptional regulator, cyclic AMP receptor protein